jgi:hypothetical protein
MSFWNDLKNQVNEINDTNDAKTKAIKDKKIAMDEQGIAYCPKCLSVSVQPMKKGFSFGKAVVGGVLTGGIGIVAGSIGANKIKMHCNKCGYKYKA